MSSLSNLDAPESMDDNEPVVSARFTGFQHLKNNPKIATNSSQPNVVDLRYFKPMYQLV